MRAQVSRQASHPEFDDAVTMLSAGSAAMPGEPYSSGSPSDLAEDEPSQNGKLLASSFRNVSACYRCRLRKNKCDPLLPSCAGCAKAKVPCVGYDAITKKAVPRSYVYYLESRIEQHEALLRAHNIPFPPPDLSAQSIKPVPKSTDRFATHHGLPFTEAEDATDIVHEHPQQGSLKRRRYSQARAMMDEMTSPSSVKSLALTSGVSFARVVIAAVQYSADPTSPAIEKPCARPSLCPRGTSMRDSFFGLHTKPTIQPAPLPDFNVAKNLVYLYFQHANPQIPILHRAEFMTIFDRVYSADPAIHHSSRELYMLNMVFAIGSGTMLDDTVPKAEDSAPAASVAQSASADETDSLSSPSIPPQPENYHASAIVHLDACLGDRSVDLEMLQAILLLANFALMRPVPPGLWYIIGVAMRLAVDLNLHQVTSWSPSSNGDVEKDHYVRDKKRRLWWCTYSIDRLVSTCVGRPFGISDLIITTDFPSPLDDDDITPEDSAVSDSASHRPSYKKIGFQYFRLRLLQSEIMQVFQFNHANVTRSRHPTDHGSAARRSQDEFVSPYLAKFDSFRSWRLDVDNRLLRWRAGAPSVHETGVGFATDFFELNYWQAILLLYRPSLTVPELFESEYDPSTEVNSPKTYLTELREDEDRIYLTVAEAGRKILRLYRKLHLAGVISYTYLTTHHLFMAGISYLYAIWHSSAVRRRLTIDEVDLSILAARSVFSDLIDKCPPAETCRDAFDRTAKATIKMAVAAGGFGGEGQKERRRLRINYVEEGYNNDCGTTDGSLAAGKDIMGPRRKADRELSLPKSGSSMDVAVRQSPIKSQSTPSMPSGSIGMEGESYAVMAPPPGGQEYLSPVGLSLQTGNNGYDMDTLLPSPPVGDGLHVAQYGQNDLRRSSGATTLGVPYVTGPGYGPQQPPDYQDPWATEWLQSARLFGEATPQDGPSDPFCWDGITHQIAEGQFGWYFFGQQAGGGGGVNPAHGYRSDV